MSSSRARRRSQGPRAEAAELEQKAETIGNRQRPLKYVVGAFLAGLLLGALVTIAAFGGIRGHELPEPPTASEGARGAAEAHR